MTNAQRRVTTETVTAELWSNPDQYWARFNDQTAGQAAPVVALHEPALMHNAAQLVRRSRGLPIRVASKSLRLRAVLETVLQLPGYAGVLAYTLPEALWLSPRITNIVVGYPTTDRHSLRHLATDEQLAANITVMIDHPDQLDLIDSVCGWQRREKIRVCIDLDASLRIGAVHLGVRRSPVHGTAAALQLARHIVARPGFTLVGVMAYEAQIAGVGNQQVGVLKGAVVRGMQAFSAHELAARRGMTVHQVRQLCELEFVNGGGTGSLEHTVQDAAVTEVTAGTGLFGPHLFDHFQAFQPAPAVAFACDVVRKPTSRMATLHGGGWVASGQAGRDRLPVPVWPAPLRLTPLEGAGEVQTPLRGAAAKALRVGDRVWMRHAKAGEIMEHVTAVRVIDAVHLPAEVPTYRGEGKSFL